MKPNQNPNRLLMIMLILCGAMVVLMGLLFLLTRGMNEEEGTTENGTAVSGGTTAGQEEKTEAVTGGTSEAASEGVTTEAVTAVTEAGTTEAVTAVTTEEATAVTTEEAEAKTTEADSQTASEAKKPEITYWFRTKAQRDQHFEKHGKEMGFATPEDYLLAANEVVKDPSSLHKIEKEDGDDVYYREADNAFVIVSTDGYIRTFFYPSGGKAYYERQ